MLAKNKNDQRTEELAKVGTTGHDLGIGALLEDTLDESRGKRELEVAVGVPGCGLFRAVDECPSFTQSWQQVVSRTAQQ